MTESTLLEAVNEVAQIAGGVALSYFGKGPAVEQKADGSPVTIADRLAEDAAREWIERRYPKDGVVGEERGETKPDARRRWIIDPIDGTKSFIHGVPLWGTLVALCEGETVLAGAAAFPALGETVIAATGAGAWWNGTRCRVSSVASVSEALVLTTGFQFKAAPGLLPHWNRLVERAALGRTWGDCYGYMLVATGRAEVMVDPKMSAWDAAAVLPIITEAGGTFTDWTGRETAFGGNAIATNRALGNEARELLGIR
ncbi:MAG TPA: histidinol-phosphatase [Gemmatimonadaceae bacterium]